MRNLALTRRDVERHAFILWSEKQRTTEAPFKFIARVDSAGNTARQTSEGEIHKIKT